MPFTIGGPLKPSL